MDECVPIWTSKVKQQNCSEDGCDAESELCLGHTGEMKRQCKFTVKRSTSEARRAKLTGSKLIKKYKQAELVKIVKLGELSL